jgi:adenosylhomocysteine nucleosidase
MRILFVAADPMEFRGLLKRAGDVRPTSVAVDFARLARVGVHEALLVANGAGWRRAAGAVDAAKAFAAEAIVSTGFCGALDEGLAVADIIAGTEVVGDGKTRPCTIVEARHKGAVASIDHVAQTAAEKRTLRATGARVVEMEAAGVAERAQNSGIAFYCIRVVTDLAGETMENDFNRALRADGHFDTMNILRGALCRPTVRLPELLRLRSRCVRAAHALGDFIVGCRL